MCTLTARVRIFLKKGQILKALQLASSSVNEKHRARADLWNLLGACLAKAGQTQEALQAFERALSLKPFDPAILNNVGNMMLITSRPFEARDYYLKAIANSAFSKQPRFNLALAYMDMGHFEKALEAYQEYKLVTQMSQSIKFVVLCACALGVYWLLRL